MSMHDVMAAIGYCVSFAGAITLVFCIIGLFLEYCWRKVWDFDAFIRVCRLAREHGIKLTRKG